MALTVKLDLTSLHIYNNLWDAGIEMLTVPQQFEYSLTKSNKITQTVSDFVIEHWHTPPGSLTISGQTKFQLSGNILTNKMNWVKQLDKLKGLVQTGLEDSNYLPVADIAYYLIYKMAEDDQKKLSEVLNLASKLDIQTKLKGVEDRVRTFLYYNFAFYEVMWNTFSISRVSGTVNFNYTLNFTVLRFNSIFDKIYRSKMGKAATQTILASELLGDMIKL